MTNRHMFSWDTFDVPEDSEYSHYLFDHFTEHLIESGLWAKVEWLLTDIALYKGAYRQPWAEARYQRDGNYTIYEQQLKELWQHADTVWQWPIALRCALIKSSIHSHSQHIKPELLAKLVTVGVPEGRWSMERALDRVSSLPELGQQIETFEELMAIGVAVPIQHALTIALTLSPAIRSRALRALLPHLPDYMLAEIRAALPSARRDQELMALLFAFVPRLPIDAHPQIHELIQTFSRKEAIWGLLSQLAFVPSMVKAEVEQWYERLCELPLPTEEFVRSIIMIAPYLPMPLMDNAYREVIDEAFGERRQPAGMMTELLRLFSGATEEVMARKGHNNDSIEYLAKHLPRLYWPEYVQHLHKLAGYFRFRLLNTMASRATPDDARLLAATADTIDGEDLLWRASAKSAIYHIWPEAERSALQDELVDLMRQTLAESHGPTVFKSILDTIPELAPRLLPLAEAVAVDKDWHQAKIFGVLAKHLDGPAADIACQKSLEAIERLYRVDRWYGNQGDWLVELAPFAPPHVQPSLYAEALQEASLINDSLEIALAMEQICVYLTPETARELYAYGDQFPDALKRIWFITDAATHLPDQHATVLDALMDTSSKLDDQLRCRLLLLLVPVLSASMRVDAIAAVEQFIQRIGNLDVATGYLIRLGQYLENSARLPVLQQTLDHFEKQANPTYYNFNLVLQWLKLVEHEQATQQLTARIANLPLLLMKRRKGGISDELMYNLLMLLRAMPGELRAQAVNSLVEEVIASFEDSMISTLSYHNIPESVVKEIAQAGLALFNAPLENSETTGNEFQSLLVGLAQKHGINIVQIVHNEVLEVYGYMALLHLSTLDVLDDEERANLVNQILQTVVEPLQMLPHLHAAILIILAKYKPDMYADLDHKMLVSLNRYESYIDIVEPPFREAMIGLLHHLLTYAAPERKAGLFSTFIAFAALLYTSQTGHLGFPELQPGVKEVAKDRQVQAEWSAALRQDWDQLLHEVASSGRPALVGYLTTFLPWLTEVDRENASNAIALGLIDVARCWP